MQPASARTAKIVVSVCFAGWLVLRASTISESPNTAPATTRDSTSPAAGTLIDASTGHTGAAYPSARPSLTPSQSPAAAPDTEEVFSRLHLTTSWHGEAGNTVMLATFSIRNRSDQAVSNFAVICTLYAQSGTVLDVKTPTLYITVPAHKSKTVRDMNLGFINQQTYSASCTLADYDAP